MGTNMNELIRLIIGLKLGALLIEPTSNTAIQAFRALFVGVIAFVADAGTLWLVSLTGLHYLACAALGFILGVYVNYVLSSRFVFFVRPKIGKSAEITVFVLVSLVGLGLTEAFLWLFTETVGLHFLLSKCVVTLLVFAWNFTARKLILYRKG